MSPQVKTNQTLYYTVDIPESLRTKLENAVAKELIPVDLICS